MKFVLLKICCQSSDEFISDVLLWTPTYGQAKAGRPARTYIQQLCDDTRCSPEDGRNGEKGLGISVLATQHDDDDIFIYTISFKTVNRLEMNNLNRVLNAWLINT